MDETKLSVSISNKSNLNAKVHKQFPSHFFPNGWIKPYGKPDETTYRHESFRKTEMSQLQAYKAIGCIGPL